MGTVIIVILVGLGLLGILQDMVKNQRNESEPSISKRSANILTPITTVPINEEWCLRLRTIIRMRLSMQSIFRTIPKHKEMCTNR